MKTYLGILIGVDGALALLKDDGDLIELWDMPTVQHRSSKRWIINAPLVAALIIKSRAEAAFVQYASGKVGEGDVGSFAFGRSCGVVEGVLAAAGISMTLISPRTLKRTNELLSGKKGSNESAFAQAIHGWPDKANWFTNLNSDARAEAAMIAAASMWYRNAR